jgi:hypothetical protein
MKQTKREKKTINIEINGEEIIHTNLQHYHLKDICG